MTGRVGYIKLHRSLLDWEWWDDHNATRVLIYLLISVNYKSKEWKGMLINPGQIVTSYESISEQTGLTLKQCRLAVDKLESGREIERKRAGKGQLVTLLKWDKLQSDEEKRAGKGQESGQLKGRQRATTKESIITKDNNTKEEKKKEVYAVPDKSEFIEFCKTIKEINFNEYQFSISSKYDSWIENGWKDGNNKPIKNWKTKIKNTIPYMKPMSASTSEQKSTMAKLNL